MVRGLIGLAGIIGLCVALFASTGDSEILWPALGLAGLGALAIVGDYSRRKITRRWAEEPPAFDAHKLRHERAKALLHLAAFAVLAFVPNPLPGTVGQVVQMGLGFVGLVGVLHYAFVVRALGREIRALRD